MPLPHNFALRAFVVLLALAPAVSVTRSQGWTRVHSTNFVVCTDAGEKRGRELAVRFEQMRHVFAKLLSIENVSTPVPLQILAFKDTKGFTQIVPFLNGKPRQNVTGVFQGTSDMNFIAVDLFRGGEYPPVYHEYSHSLLLANFRQVPLWFNEGLAVYYETIKIDQGNIEIGASPKYASTFLYHRALMPVSDLFTVKTYHEDDVKEALFYFQSWLVVHYLFDKDKLRDFAKYMELTSSQHVPVPAAIEQAFGMSPKNFDTEIAAYLNLGQRQVFNVTDSASVDAEKIVAERLSSDDTAALIASMHLHSYDYHDQAIDEFKTILARNPNQLEANLGLGYAALLSKKYDDADSYLRKAVSLDPKSARALFLLGALQVQRDSSDENRQDRLVDAWNNLKTATRLSPQIAEPHNQLAVALEKLHDTDGAIAEAVKAALLNQGDEHYFLHLAELYLASKKFDKASVLFEQLASSDDLSISSLAAQRLQSLRSSSVPPRP